MNFFKTATMAAAMLAGVTSAHAQLSSVRYGLKYNTATCKYDVYMRVMGGSATGADQEALTGQLTIVVDHGTTIGGVSGTGVAIPTTAITSNEPKSGSISGNSVTRTSTPTLWTNQNVAIQRGALSTKDAYTFVPNPSNAFYPPMSTGDTVVLFSISISTSTCGSNIRLWNNNSIQGTLVTGGDPVSALFGGDDYNNGMLIGTLNQLYTSNATTINPPKPVITASRAVLTNGIYLTATANTGSTCLTIPSNGYQWSGPASYSSTQQNPVIFPYTAANLGTYSVTVTNSAGCSTTLPLASIPLPVTLAGFSAMANNCSAALSWTTSSESSFDRFAVQYSENGSVFMTVGEVPSKKAATGSEYSFSYAQPSGKGYYRLKMIDLNGAFSYSETVSLSTSCGTVKGDISISPNPTSGLVSVRGIAAGAEIRIIDMLGKIVATEVSAGSAITVDLGKYANGMYNVLVAQNGGWEKVGQIVKN